MADKSLSNMVKNPSQSGSSEPPSSGNLVGQILQAGKFIDEPDNRRFSSFPVKNQGVSSDVGLSTLSAEADTLSREKSEGKIKCSLPYEASLNASNSQEPVCVLSGGLKAPVSVKGSFKKINPQASASHVPRGDTGHSSPFALSSQTQRESDDSSSDEEIQGFSESEEDQPSDTDGYQDPDEDFIDVDLIDEGQSMFEPGKKGKSQ